MSNNTGKDKKEKRTAVKDPVVEFDNKIKGIPAATFKGSDKVATASLTKLLKGTNIVIKQRSGLNPYQSVNFSYKGKEKVITFNDPLSSSTPEELKQEFESWVNEDKRSSYEMEDLYLKMILEKEEKEGHSYIAGVLSKIINDQKEFDLKGLNTKSP